MTGIPTLDHDDLGAIAALCGRAIANAPRLRELELALFAPQQPAVLRGDPSVGVVATVECEVDRWLATHWANWRAESLRALDNGNLVLCRDDRGISGICAFEVNRSGALGPVAVRPDLMGRGCGRRALLGALHELRRRRPGHIDVSWVGPIPPYAALGGHVSNIYFVYRRELR